MSSTVQQKILSAPEEILIPYHNKLYIEGDNFDFYRKAKVEKSEEWLYPGRGTSNPTCGRFKASYICECRKTKKAIQMSCDKIECPICFHKAIKRKAKTITKNFVKKHIILNRPKLHHFSLHTGNKKLINKVLKKYNMGGVLIFHNWRINHNSSTPALKIFPHYHFVGSGKFPKSDEFYDDYGFTYKNIRKVSNKKQLYLTFRYLLSHCGYKRGKFSYSYRGCYSHNHFEKYAERKGTELLICENCETPLQKITDEPTFKLEKGMDDWIYVYNEPIQTDKTKCLKRKIDTYKLRLKDGTNRQKRVDLYT